MVRVPTAPPKGFVAGADWVHFKLGLVSLVLALILFAIAWFQRAPQRR